MAIGDYITILRDGRFQAEAAVKDIDVPWIVREMLGSDPVSSFLRPGRSFGEPMMEVEDVTLINESGNTVVNHVSLHVRAGEIVGIYGLMGRAVPNCSNVYWARNKTILAPFASMARS